MNVLNKCRIYWIWRHSPFSLLLPVQLSIFVEKNSNYLSLWFFGVPGTPGITQELTSLPYMENSGFDCSEVKENFQD